MIWVAKNLYFFNCLLDGAHTKKGASAPFFISFYKKIRKTLPDTDSTANKKAASDRSQREFFLSSE